MSKISVITPSVRPEGLKLVEKALKRQTFKDFEWIVQDRENLPEGCVWTLNRDYNKAIRKSKGELIVSWQDWTYAKPDTLERFWTHYELEPTVLVGAVGDKYADDTWTVKTWQDPRERDDQGTYYPCFFNDIEWNLCSVPRKALEAVGGFDENMDQFYGMDGYSVNERINMVGGFDFKLDQSIKSYSLEHGRNERWDDLNWLGERYNNYHIRYVENPRLPYLE